MKKKVLWQLSLFFIVSCKPPTVLFYSAGGMVQEDKTGGWESIEQVILRYQKGDTLQYMVDYYASLEDYPREIHSPYICYIPEEQSGVLGVHVGKGGMPPLDGKSILHSLEIVDFQDIESYNIYYLPLYRYQIHHSFIQFHKMSPEERTIDTLQTFSPLYTKGKWLRSRLYMPLSSKEVEVEPNVKMIYNQIFDVSYKYFNGSDTIFQYEFRLNSLEARLFPNIPMYFLPLVTDVYYQKNMRKYLVKQRQGYYIRGERREYLLDDYRHEIDTALLALPVRIFQEKYLQTNDIYCLDGLIVNR